MQERWSPALRIAWEFDPTQFPPPSVAKSLEEAKVGDLGIHLMHSFASDMHYEGETAAIG